MTYNVFSSGTLNPTQLNVPIAHSFCDPIAHLSCAILNIKVAALQEVPG